VSQRESADCKLQKTDRALLRRSFFSTSNPIRRNIALCRDDIPSTRLIIAGHQKSPGRSRGQDWIGVKQNNPGRLTAWQRAMMAAEQQRGWS
jgi:hypothetical protein